MNELSRETSPYLLQHATNPVHWKAWKPETLQNALRQDRLLILSAGYAACHWCHVMEHETFENPDVAAVMNRDFISVKIDREERPDVDAVYMKAVQLMTRHGGWPLNVVALPDGRPVWGGTYFRTQEWMESLRSLAEMFRNDRSRMEDYAQKLHEGMVASNLLPQPLETQEPLFPQLETLVAKWKRSFDPEDGGYARAPKFMLPDNWRFLLHYGTVSQDDEILKQVRLTLDKMAQGGLFDQVGGGFSRYSVDSRWHVPHFEKMLYDNGLLLQLYAQAHRAFPSAEYHRAIQKTLGFLDRELRSTQGVYFASLDADSLNIENHLEEGAFYIWTEPELRQLLGPDFEAFAHTYSINETGHWEHGRYVLYRTGNFTESPETIARWENLLLEQRSHRPRPRLDDKIITSWNALLISGLCQCFQTFGDEKIHNQAVALSENLLRSCRDKSGKLTHTSSGIPAFLEDYAALAVALLDVYEISLDERWLGESRQLTDEAMELFFDAQIGYFLFNPIDGEQLISPHYEMEDNVIPASNSMMAEALWRISRHFDHQPYEKLARDMVRKVVSQADYPSAFSHWLGLALEMESTLVEAIVIGPEADRFARKLFGEYLPGVIVAASKTASELPLLKNRFVEGKTVGYLCREKTCSLPMENAEDWIREIRQACIISPPGNP